MRRPSQQNHAFSSSSWRYCRQRSPHPRFGSLWVTTTTTTLLLLLLQCPVTWAGKDRITVSPTFQPSWVPSTTPSWQPTLSSRPSIAPTTTTALPSVAPTTTTTTTTTTTPVPTTTTSRPTTSRPTASVPPSSAPTMSWAPTTFLVLTTAAPSAAVVPPEIEDLPSPPTSSSGGNDPNTNNPSSDTTTTTTTTTTPTTAVMPVPQSPTLSPTSLGTTTIVSPPPSPSPTVASTTLVSVTLSTILIAFQLPPGEPLDDQMFQHVLRIFLQDVLDTNNNSSNQSNKNNPVVVMTDIESAVTYQSADGGGVAVLTGTWTGQARFAPTTKSLIQHFAFWGIADLERSLREANIPIQSIKVQVDGRAVQAVEEANPNSLNDDDERDSSVLIAAVILGLVALVVSLTVILLVTQRLRARKHEIRELEHTLYFLSDQQNPKQQPRKQRRRPSRPPVDASQRYRDLSSSAAGEITPVPIAAVRPPTSIGIGGDTDNNSSFGTLSVDGSALTAKSMVPPITPPQPLSFVYDPSRLDRVISSAKGLVQEMDEETADVGSILDKDDFEKPDAPEELDVTFELSSSASASYDDVEDDDDDDDDGDDDDVVSVGRRSPVLRIHDIIRPESQFRYS